MLEQFEEARADYDTAIRLNPDHATAYYHRGGMEVRLENFDNANKSLRYALQQAAQVGDTNLIVRIGQLLQEIESQTVG